MAFDRLKALLLLSQCTGDDIWSPEHCRQQGVPSGWLDELVDNYESNLQRDIQTIYLGNQVTNQYRGLRDVDLACKLAEYLGVDVSAIVTRASSRRHLVRLLVEAVEED